MNQPSEDSIREAIKITVQVGYGSVSALQRHMRLSYNQAETIVRILEERGIVTNKNDAMAVPSATPRMLIRKSHLDFIEISHEDFSKGYNQYAYETKSAEIRNDVDWCDQDTHFVIEKATGLTVAYYSTAGPMLRFFRLMEPNEPIPASRTITEEAGPVPDDLPKIPEGVKTGSTVSIITNATGTGITNEEHAKVMSALYPEKGPAFWKRAARKRPVRIRKKSGRIGLE